jgi:predicted DNA-binding transcriptional regulator YafY
MPSPEDAWRRRLHLLRLLIQRGEITTARAAAALECDRRVALEDLKALERHEVPLEPDGSGQDRRWVLGASWRYLGLRISFADRLGMMFGRELVRSFLRDTDVGDAVDRLENQVAALEPEAPNEATLRRRFHYIHEPEKDYRGHRATVRALVDALVRGHRVSFEYRSARSKRSTTYSRAAPLTLAAYKRGLYLFFRECPSQRIKELAVERITGLEPHPDATFEYPLASEYDPVTLLAGRFGITSHHEPVSRVRIWCAPEVRDYAAGRRWTLAGSSVRDHPDGSCELSFSATGHELVSLVLSFGDKAEVLEPAWLRASVRAELEAAVARYRASESDR